MMKFLITGFDPFGGEKTNPAWEAVKRLPDVLGLKDGSQAKRAELIKLEIPTVFATAPTLVIDRIKAEQPDVVLSVGQAGGRAMITPEMVAINLQRANLEDNAGEKPHCPIIESGAPDGYFTSLPVEQMVIRMREAGIPAKISFSAGTFVCNTVMFSTLHYIKSAGLDTKAGFIHVPYLPEQVTDKPGTTPSMSLDLIVEALKVGLLTVLESLD